MSPSSYGLRTISQSRFFRFSPLSFISVVAIPLIFLLFPKNAHSTDVTLSWDANSEEDLAGYRIFYREAGQSYDYNDPLWEGSETTCTAYNLDDMTTHCFVVRAFDTSGNESGDSNEVCYQPSFNLAPAADAGPDQTVDEGLSITLDSSNSTDADGTIASYLWTQKAGTSVTLSDAASAQPTFTAPYVGLTGEALTFQLTVTDNGGLADTDTVIINVSNVNQAPTADAGPDQTVHEADTVTLDGSNSSDPDGSVVTYSWTQIEGIPATLSDTTEAKPVFTAPDVTSQASLKFKLSVSDDGGLQSEDTCIVNVSGANMAPVADAGPDQTVNEGIIVTLDGSNSSDPDGTIASFLWKQTAGSSVTLSNVASAQASFIAPYVSPSGEALRFELTVQDGGGLADTDTVIVNVGNVNLPPSADAGPDQEVLELSTVMLDGSNSSDEDGTVIEYGWSQIGGLPVTLSEATTAQPIFVAPDVGPDGASLTFQLTVRDELGLESQDTCIVNVSWVNMPPTSDAGPDQTVNEGIIVTLDGSNSSDPDGTIASFLWKQTAGSSVTLSNVASAQASFIAPYVSPSGEALRFELTVQDGGGLADTDTVIVNVSNVNLPPIAEAGDNQTVQGGNIVTLDSSHSWDPDGDEISQLWKQTDGTPVTLSDPRTMKPTFTVPPSDHSGVVKFQVTVTDTGELSSADNVDIDFYPSSGSSIQTIFDLEAKPIGKGIRLDWSPAPDAGFYNIYRSYYGSGPYSQIGEYPASDRCTFLDSDISYGITYYYMIRSVTGGIESLDSNKASATLMNRGVK